MLQRALTADYVIGVDEVGTGAIAGPVVVAATVFPGAWRNAAITDSKKLTRKKREHLLYSAIYTNALTHFVLFRCAADIDRYGINNCRKALTEEAILKCRAHYPQALAVQDGDDPALVNGSLDNVVYFPKADSKVLAVSAASILAKVSRDNVMKEHALLFPMYGFDVHAGYGTQAHLAALLQYGPCYIHRLSFRPIPAIVQQRAKLAAGG